MVTTPINDVTPFVQYTASAAADTFAYTWWVREETDLAVYVDGVLADPADYSVSAVQSSTGGNVVFTTPMTGGEVVTISTELPFSRLTGFATSGSLRASALNLELSYMIACLQELRRDQERSLNLSPTSSVDPDNFVVPEPSDGKLLYWDGADGTLSNTTLDVTALEALGSDVTTVATNIASVNTVATNVASVNTCATNITDIQNAATNAAAAVAAKTAAETAQSAAEAAQTVAETSETNAAASAAAAAAAVASGLYNDVVAKSFADSPLSPVLADEGTLYRVDTSGGNVVINLASLATYGEDMKLAFVKTTADGNTVTINRGGTDTIQGATSAVLSSQYEIHVLIGDSATGTWVDSVQSATIADGSITNAKLADMAQNTLKGRVTAGTGDPEDLTATQVRSILNVENGATADQSDAEIETAYNNRVSIVSQAEAEAGVATTRRGWTAERVAQAIAALAPSKTPSVSGEISISAGGTGTFTHNLGTTNVKAELYLKCITSEHGFIAGDEYGPFSLAFTHTSGRGFTYRPISTNAIGYRQSLDPAVLTHLKYDTGTAADLTAANWRIKLEVTER